ISKIFKGEIKNWKEVGGKDIPISLYGRQGNSGTFVYFRDNVVRADYSDRMRRMNGNAQIVEVVRRDVSGIGYVGVGYVLKEGGKVTEGIKVIEVAKDKNSPAVSPLNPENVKKGLYPITRPLYQYSNGVPGGNLLDFIKFELSDEGQKIVMEEGFYPISQQYKRLNQKNIGL
ncbi:substrate-binding domain-containing protein, partial [Candidatus Aerophobetes bacterium]|nr:substrate-binding domain-containing protein [Candidatus Aerophobetes bacterium]